MRSWRSDAWAVGRKAYVSIVDRRSVVRIHVASTTPNHNRPTFVMANYRSGTTLLRYVLDSHPRIAVPPESDFIQTLGPLLLEPASSGLHYMGFDREHVLQRIREFIQYFFANYAASQGKRIWVDKSPLYVNHIDLIRELFPDARFIVLHRHPLDQVHSVTKNGAIRPPLAEPGGDVRLAAARLWSVRTRALVRLANEADSLTMRYEDLCAEPEATLRRLFCWLGEPWDSRVLRFNEFEHDFGKEAIHTRSTSGFDKQIGKFHEWPSAIRDRSWAEVSALAEPLGYTADPSHSYVTTSAGR